MQSSSKRFLKFCKRLGNWNAKYACWDIQSRYTEPWRAYHTLKHINAMLDELDAFRDSEEAEHVDLESIEMAIWYHDVVYNPQAKDNEERSADLFLVVAKKSGLIPSFTESVLKSILATKHLVTSDNFDAAVLCDIDLAILGQPKETFDEYERQIREEYQWVPESQFREGRMAILQSFLQRRSIYSTKFFREKYEEQARKNLVRSIRKLQLSPI